MRAARDPDSASSARWRQLASEYELLADDLDESPPSAAIDRRVLLQGNQQHHARQDRRGPGQRAAIRVPAAVRKTAATD